LSAEPFIAVLIGPGGVGKGTLARRLVDADERLWLSKSWTTRPVRDTEDGTEYHFVDRATFEKAIEDDAFLEWAEFHGNLYGTPRPAAGDRDVLLEIEVQAPSRSSRTIPRPWSFSSSLLRWNNSRIDSGVAATPKRTCKSAFRAHRTNWRKAMRLLRASSSMTTWTEQRAKSSLYWKNSARLGRSPSKKD